MLGSASYGGHSFTPFARTRLRVKNVYTDSGQDVTHRLMFWEISDYVSVETGNTDGDFDTLKQKLERPRQSFTYTGRGAGINSINVTSMNDVNMGPKPQIVSWNPVGASMALHFIWTVEICVLPPCASGSTPIEAGIKAWETEVEAEIDKYLRSKLTYSGYIEIIQNTASTDSLDKADYADWYRGVLGLNCPPGFQPNGEKFTQNSIGNRLNFSVSYKEMYEVLPPGILEGRGKHKIKNAKPNTTCQWLSTLACTFVVADPDNRAQAFNAFMTILSNKMGQLLQGQRANPVNAAANIANIARGLGSGGIWGGVIAGSGGELTTSGFQYISDVEMECGVMDDKEVSLSVTILIASNLEDILQDSGLFNKIGTGSRALDWEEWKAADRLNIMDGHRGLAQFNVNGSQALVNLCTGDAQPPGSGNYPVAGYGSDGPSGRGGGGSPASRSSVVEASIYVEEHADPAVIVAVPTGSASSGSAGNPVAQGLGADTGIMVVAGYIVGANFPPAFPVISTIGGYPVQPLPSMVVRSVVGQKGNVVLHGVAFRIVVRAMAPANSDAKDKQGRLLKGWNPNFPLTNQRPSAASAMGGFPYTGSGGLVMGGSDSYDTGSAGAFTRLALAAAQSGIIGPTGFSTPEVPVVTDGSDFQRGSSSYQRSLREQGISTGGGSDPS